LNSKPQNTEYNLALLLKEGNTEAFKIIFNQYKSKLYFFTLAYLHSPAEVDEIIQDVFLSLWEHRQSLNETLSIKSYLYKITVNHILNHLKHEAVKQKFINYALKNQSEVDDQSQESIDFDDLKVMIESIIERLPAQQQKIFKMSRWEGLSHDEIATQLGISVRSVENQVYRALKFIKANLKEEYLTI
jgi:RNA polymerase sigma-70 factor, ECF subfamily